MHLHSTTRLWIQEQDREHTSMQRALRRAAREAARDRAGLERGGISSFGRLRRAAAGALQLRSGRNNTIDLTGTSGA